MKFSKEIGVITMRKTKIICTIGPASSSEEVLTQMCEAGMNVARLNFSHGDHEEQLGKIKVINKVRDKMGLPISMLPGLKIQPRSCIAFI